jgi:Flp pilus assembly protein TadG
MRFKRRTFRSGNAGIEMVIVLPVLSFLGLGLAEFGQYFYINNAFENAARDAARYAIPANAAKGDPAAAATAALAAANITFNSSWMNMYDESFGIGTVTDCSTVPMGHLLVFTISVQYSSLPGVYRPLSAITGFGVGSKKMIVAKCSMIKE